MRKYHSILISFLTLTSINACAYSDHHERFLRIMGMSVGSRLLYDNEYRRTTSPLSIKKLTNGNVEYRYPYSTKTCVTVYEINPQTEIIIRFSFEGEKKDCVWMP